MASSKRYLCSSEPVPQADLGRSIRIRRIGLGISRKELASALGISVDLLKRYESGTENISPEELIRFAEKLATDVCAFYFK